MPNHGVIVCRRGPSRSRHSAINPVIDAASWAFFCRTTSRFENRPYLFTTRSSVLGSDRGLSQPRIGSPGVNGMGFNDKSIERPKSAVTQAEAEAAVRVLIEWAGDDPDREGLIDTPARVARSTRSCSPATRKIRGDYLERTFQEVGGYDELVVLLERSASSASANTICCRSSDTRMSAISHATASSAFPSSRAWCTAFRRRLQIQEKLTADIAEAIQKF